MNWNRIFIARNIVTAAGCLLLALALVFTLAGCGTAHALPVPSATVELPFTSSRSLLLVSVTIDGQPKTLIFDTGAERTMVHRIGQSVEHRATVLLPGNTLVNFPVILADLSDVQISKAGADGVLGEDVLRKFNTVSIDYARKVITLGPRIPQ